MALIEPAQDATVSYRAFLQLLRGSLSPQRLALVTKAFAGLDTAKRGAVPLSALLNYNPQQHPDVVSGQVSADELRQLFLGNFSSDPGQGQVQVSARDFQEYYATVSAFIAQDDFFAAMMQSAWKI
jgi:hypothetical protein